MDEETKETKEAKEAKIKYHEYRIAKAKADISFHKEKLKELKGENKK